GDFALGVAANGDLVYVANGSNGLRIIDVSTPTSPVEVGFYDTGVVAWGVALSGSYAYVADQEDGIYIIQNDLLVGINEETSFSPGSFLLAQNYPNPFNPTTTINYQISEIGFVALKVFDVLGNEISTLVNEEKPAGSYEVDFDSQGLSSGIYFYKLQAGNFVETKKMVFLK
ncbi:MAG: T9SS type A sorting domain-containing protein, partial [Ignavibacteriaceae bacterium]